MFSPEPQVEAEGVLFQIRVEQRFHVHQLSSVRKCFISNDALTYLAERRNINAGRREAFLAMQPTILGVARRLAQAGVPGDPLQLARSSFI